MKIKKIIACMGACTVAAFSSILPSAFVSAAETGKAVIVGQAGENKIFDNSENPVPEDAVCAEINGDAQYYVSTVMKPSKTVEFLAVKIYNLTEKTFPKYEIKVDSIKIDGNEVNGAVAGAVIEKDYKENGSEMTRIVLTDTWSDTKVQAVPENTEIGETVEVLFTVSGTGVEGTSNVPQPTEATEPTTEPTEASTESSSESVTTLQTTRDMDSALYNYLRGRQTTSPANGNRTSGGGNVNSTNTGDKGIAIAVAGLAVAAAVAVISKRK